MKLIAYFILALAVITTPIAMALANLEGEVFDIQIYRDAIAQEGVYDQLPALISTFLEAKANDRSSPVTAVGIRSSTIETLLGAILPPEALRTAADDLLVDIFDYVEYRRDTVSLSVIALRIGLNSPQGVEAIKAIMAASPRCTVDQLDAMFINAFFSRVGELMLCNPPAEFHADQGTLIFKTYIPLQIMRTTAGLPDQVMIIAGTPAQEAFRAQVRQGRVFLRYAPLLPLVLLLLSTPFAVGSWTSWLVWWGQGLSAAGLLGVLPRWVGRLWITSNVKNLMMDRISGFLPTLIQQLPRTVGPLVSQAAEGLLSRLMDTLLAGTLQATEQQSVILAVVGVSMLVLGVALWVLRRRRTPA